MSAITKISRTPVEVLAPPRHAETARATEARAVAHAGAPEMRCSSPRLEAKAVIREFELPRVMAELKLSLQVLRRHHPPRVVQSIYLDTHDSRALWENLDGDRDRAKLRFRWYGEASATVTGVLERKVRRDRLGWKESFSVPAPVLVSGASRHGFMSALRSAAPARFASLLSGAIGPTLWIAYNREYYLTGNGRVRVTADRGLRSFDLRDAATISTSRPLPMPRLAVLEFKAAPEDERQIEAMLSRLPLLVHRCSKYVMAGSPGHGPLPPL